MLSGSPSHQKDVHPAVMAASNNMNSKVNKHVSQLPENLRLNGRTPSGKPRLFVCQICTRAFARQEHLTRHERSHTKEKPYSCGICNRNFSRRDLLLRHANKIHGGNFGDSIIKHNKATRNKVGKRRQSASNPSPPSTNENHTRNSSHSAMMKRRASYSAQSGTYVAPIQNKENHKFDRVRFSTPELLPINLKEHKDDSFPDFGEIVNDRNSVDMATAEVPEISMGSPTDFNLLDSVHWINDYNNEPFNTSETGTGTGTAKTRTGTTNSANISPDSNNTNFNLQTAIPTPGNSTNIRSSWSINEADGELQMKSLFSTISPSSSSKDNSVLPNSSAANSTAWLKPPSEVPTNLNPRKSPIGNRSEAISSTMSGAGAVSEKLQHIQFEESTDTIPNYVLYEKANLQEIVSNGETQIFKPLPVEHESLVDQFENEKYTTVEDLGTSDPADDPTNNYTSYGLDFLTSSQITKAPPPNIEGQYLSLPKSDIFTQELRQLCLDASNFYGEHYSDAGIIDRNSRELTLPTCDELNLYVSYYQEFFNSHHPFIHPDFFNLDLISLKKYVHESFTVDEENDCHLLYSNVVCLPLFVATVGSLFKPEPNPKTMTLYEISRRVLHVFLERRKEQQQPSSQKDRTSQRPGQHVWLIQSLSLSIIFALFADSLGQVEAEMIKRQVSAVCSIIKNNFLTAICTDIASLSGNSDSSVSRRTDFSSINTSFAYVMLESKIRCTLVAYKFCQFLRIFYNVDAKLFLNEHDIESICIPDDEVTWNKASLFSAQEPMMKQNVTSFRKFYDSFTFNHSGMKPIPESLASIMLYYEFNITTHSTFHVFLTRIDTKKLEKNLSQIQSYLNFNDFTSAKSNCTAVLKSDSVVLRNCLMTMNFLLQVDRDIGSKVWNGQIKSLFNSFISPKTLNILSKGSYNLLTDFLVALNSSIKNIAKVFKLTNSRTSINLDKKIMSMFNLQAYHNDFLVIVKFIMDFEHKPNFKLLCIFTELKKLADRLLIPFFSRKFPLDFAQFEDISMTNSFIQQNSNSISDSHPQYSSINVEELEKLINNVLVYSFNDSSFLKMPEQSTNEFSFNSEHPSYNPFDYPVTESLNLSDLSVNRSDHEIHSNSKVDTFSARTKVEPTLTKSFVELLSFNPSKQSSDCFRSNNGVKQGFAERYRLSEKYVVIAKCFFTYVRESYVNCHILDRMKNDFKDLQVCIDSERDLHLASNLKNKGFSDGKNRSTRVLYPDLNGFETVNISHNGSPPDVLDGYLRSEV